MHVSAKLDHIARAKHTCSASAGNAESLTCTASDPIPRAQYKRLKCRACLAWSCAARLRDAGRPKIYAGCVRYPKWWRSVRCGTGPARQAAALRLRLPPDLQAELFAVFDIQIIWNAPMRQATFRATISDTTPALITALLTRAGDQPTTGTATTPPGQTPAPDL